MSIVSELENKVSFNPFTGPEVSHLIPITQPQSEIWTACQFGGDDASRSYNDSMTLVLKGAVNQEAVEQAFKTIVKRHDSLRSSFAADGRFMIVFSEIPYEISFQDLTKESQENKIKTLKSCLNNDANHVFDLCNGPLFRASLIKVSLDEYRFIFTAHHIICDGWSFGILLEELGALYSAHISGESHKLPEQVSFSTIANTLQDTVESDEYQTIEDFWLNQYKGAVPTVDLPTDFSRPKLRTYDSNRVDYLLDEELLQNLKKVGVSAGASLVTTLLAVFEILIYKLTGQEEVVVGLPTAGQSATGFTQLIGHCVNLLPLRSTVNNKESFVEYLEKRKTYLFDAYDHQQLSFGQLLQKLPIPRDASRIPLVPLMFNIDMGMDDMVAFKGLEYELISNPRNFEAFEIFLNATGTKDSLLFEWSYNTSLFKEETIKEMMDSFTEIMKSVVAEPNTLIGEFVGTDFSAYEVLNNTNSEFPNAALHELLDQSFKRLPKKQAIEFLQSTFSYKDIEEQTNQMAHYLVEVGVVPGDFIGVALPRSIELVVALIAIMKCGAAYVPLDPSYPKQRLEFMIEDSEAKFLITTEDFSSEISFKGNFLAIDKITNELAEYSTTPLDIQVNPKETAYVLYTSGSTGKPKGVQVNHSNLVNFLFSMAKQPGLEESDRLLSITTISFDISGLELFLPLLKGATLILANDETAKDGRIMFDVLKQQKISVLQATPTTWQMLLDTGWKDENKLPLKALCGGEALPMPLAKELGKRVNELWNVYGPTETTIWSAVKKIGIQDNLITIGKPIDNTQLYITDEQGHLLAPDKAGELCIAGEGVAKGYWKRDDLNAEKFIDNPFSVNGKLYKTGDLAFLNKDGEIECLGRIDQQVKIRGHRIELGEIEECVQNQKGIRLNAVTVKNDVIHAFLVLKDNVVNSDAVIAECRLGLSKKLPIHMVPKQYHVVEELPTTLNGKIDRKALLVEDNYGTSNESLTAPRNHSEQLLVEIWKECLGLDSIDIFSDFFELGGHSLMAIKMMSRIEAQTGQRLPLASLLEHATIAKLAKLITDENSEISQGCLVPLKTNGDKTPLYIVHGANHNVLAFKNLADNLDKNQPVYGIQAKGLDGDVEPDDTVEKIAAHYVSEIMASNPEGPYSLAGFSFGGIVAFEMARLLKAKGKKVKIVALFDSYVYPNYYFKKPVVKGLVTKLYSVAHLFFLGFNMFSSKKNFDRRIGLLKERFEGIILRLKHGSEKQYEKQFKRSPKVDIAHHSATLKYEIKPQDIVVDLFRASKDVVFVHDRNLLGWKRVGLKGIRKHMVPGNHADMFTSPNVVNFGESLQDVLDNYDTTKE